jgi:hypothetical protein
MHIMLFTPRHEEDQVIKKRDDPGWSAICSTYITTVLEAALMPVVWTS